MHRIPSPAGLNHLPTAFLSGTPNALNRMHTTHKSLFEVICRITNSSRAQSLHSRQMSDVVIHTPRICCIISNLILLIKKKSEHMDDFSEVLPFYDTRWSLPHQEPLNLGLPLALLPSPTTSIHLSAKTMVTPWNCLIGCMRCVLASQASLP